MYDTRHIPVGNPYGVEQSDRLRKALATSLGCDNKDGSPTPGCGRRLSQEIASMAFRLNQLRQVESDPYLQEKIGDAIAALGTIIDKKQ